MKLVRRILKKLSKIFKSRRALVIAALILAVAFFVLTRGSADLAKIKTFEITKKSLKIEVSASGKIASEHESTIHSAVSGKVVWIGVSEGDWVRAGQAIATFDRERYEIALRQAEQDVIAADAVLAKVYDDISKASGVETFDNRIKRTSAEAVKNKAFDAVKAAERNLRDTTIISPVTGRLVELDISTLEEILPTTNVAKIASFDNLDFVAEVDENDICKIKIGQSSVITLDAYQDESIKSKVDFIGGESITTSTGATAFSVKLPIDDEGKYRLGMNGEAKIEILQTDETQVVPLEAIVNERYVYVKRGNQFEKREVKMGTTTDAETQILWGVDVGENVVVAGFDQIGKKSLLQKLIERFT